MNCHYTSSGECLNQGDCICEREWKNAEINNRITAYKGFVDRSFTQNELGDKPQENTPKERKGLIESVQEFAGVLIALAIAFGVVWAAVKVLK